MLTADTITDEQIRELLRLVWDGQHDDPCGLVSALCVRALRAREPTLETRTQYRRVRANARARCAEILNARGVK